MTMQKQPQNTGVKIQPMKTHMLPVKGLNIEKAERDKMLQSILVEEERIGAITNPGPDDVMRVRLPEHVFRNNFLPIIDGTAFSRLPEGVTPDQLSDQAAARWLSVSRGPLNEVDVVEPNGKVAFTIPAFFNTSSLNIEQDRTVRPLKQFAKDYQNHRDSVPAMANAALQQGLDMKFPHLVSTLNGEDSRAKMEKVYAYYKISNRDSKKPAEKEQGADSIGFLGEMSWD